jgi:hypothetical protein
VLNNLAHATRVRQPGEDITGIQSESDGDYIGRYKPTLNDYKRWSDWLEKNRDRLYWDDKNQTVIVK